MKRVLSTILCALMVFTLLVPFSALADGSVPECAPDAHSFIPAAVNEREHVYKCEICGKEDVTEEHALVDVPDDSGRTACSVCGYCPDAAPETFPHHHFISNWKVVKEADCVNSGLTERHCNYVNCFYKETQEIPATGHDFTEWRDFPPSCTEDGETMRYCQNSGCSYEESIPIPATGHNFGEWRTMLLPDCYNEGIRAKHCLNQYCEYYETEPIPIRPHDYKNGVCIYCEAEDPNYTPNPITQFFTTITNTINQVFTTIVNFFAGLFRF